MKKQHGKLFAISAIVFFVVATGCNKSTSTATDSNSSNTDVLTLYKRIYGATSITQDGNTVVITTNGLPDYKSPYYKGTQWEDSLYEAYNGTNTNFFLAPGRIASQTMTFRIPLDPAENSSHQATPLGPIGIALNGVPFFNQYAGNGAALGSQEINTFDEQDGHPTPMNAYHYHAEPFWLTKMKGSNALLGFLLDGFPVYGPIENGKTVSNSDLDSYHGHFGVTADYPNGVYHYHVTAEAPYINGSGFYGTPGTVTQ